MDCCLELNCRLRHHRSIWRCAQATASAYAEREVLAASIPAAEAAPPEAAVLKLLVQLFAVRRLQADLGWLLTESLLSASVAQAIPGGSLPSANDASSSQHTSVMSVIQNLRLNRGLSGCLGMVRNLCKQLAPLSLQLVEAFGIPDWILAAPLAADWESYNEQDNQGELCSML